MIVCINKYGRVLHCGDIINYVYIPFNEFAGLKVRLVYPVKTGSSYDKIVGIDRDGNYYLDVIGSINYTAVGRIESIGGYSYSYNNIGLIGKIAYTDITYNSFEKVESIGSIKLEYSFKSKHDEYYVTKIGSMIINYNDSSSPFFDSCAPTQIGSIRIDYNCGFLSSVNWEHLSYYKESYESIGCCDVMNGRLYRIGSKEISYELKGNNAGCVKKIDSASVSYYSLGVSNGLVRSYKGQSVTYDSSLRISKIG